MEMYLYVPWPIFTFPPIFTSPFNVGAVFKTTLPDPVLLDTPVPPRDTLKIPLVMLDAFNDVIPAPLPDITFSGMVVEVIT
jgi:hypothetical protein